MTFTRQEVRALKHLAPMYKNVRGKSKEVQEDFFERAYLIWFDYCPLFRSLDMNEKDFEKCKHKRRMVFV